MFPLLLALAGTPAAGQIPPPLTPVEVPQPIAPVPPPLPPPPVPVLDACPMWNRYFQMCSDCAGPGRPPFEKHPRVCLVAVCGCDPDGRGPVVPRTPPWIKEFSSAAIIPYPRFDTDGRPVPGDGLVIYEGMRLIVNPDTGEYDLTFTATVPNMPVTLRMQLEFMAPLDREGFCPLGRGGKSSPPEFSCPSDRYVLTLPPIRLQPKQNAKLGVPADWTFHVAHRGYSTLFLAPKPPNVQFIPAPTRPPSEGLKALLCGTSGSAVIDAKWSVKRDAVARFGTPVAIDDPNQ